MVMPAEELVEEPQAEVQDQTITDTGDAAPEDELTPQIDGEAEPASAEAVAGPGSPTKPPEQQEPEVAQRQRAQYQELQELQQRRTADMNREWEGQVARKAKQIEQRLLEAGHDQRVARQFAGDHVRHQKELRSQEGKAMDLIGFVEGRQNAAMHFAQKHKLVPKQFIDDLIALSSTRTPQEMEREARRMATTRQQSAEITRLKQGRVGPQTFDNSQGAAEATTNQDRLLEAYINGDRSEAAVSAARNMTFGS